MLLPSLGYYKLSSRLDLVCCIKTGNLGKGKEEWYIGRFEILVHDDEKGTKSE